MLVQIPKRKKRPILHARSAVGYNPVLARSAAWLRQTKSVLF
jgi:hypothetical protein